MSQEQNQRLQLLNSLLKTPHRDLSESYPIHQRILSEDPLFYVRLAAWYSKNGEIRDHEELFVINLCLSDFEGHREVGLAMLRELPPRRVANVVNFIKGHTIKTVVNSQGTGRKRRMSSVSKKIGLNRDIPRSLRTELRRYLRERELNDGWFDSSVAVARKYMRFLYRVAMRGITKDYDNPQLLTDRAKAILFEDKPPADSSLFVIKNLNKLTDPIQQAKYIIEHKVPYRIASTVIKQMTPTVLLALIEVMSDQELINSIGSLKRHGVFENADLKKLVNEKLQKAKKSKKGKVAALKSLEAVKAADVDGEIAESLKEVADKQLKAKGRITRPTALFVDKSSSMSGAIELGKRMGSLVSSVTDADFFCYAFDSMPYPIVSKGETIADWEKAFSGVRASGMTSIGCPFKMMIKKKQYVEQVMIITDEGETTSPAFLKSYREYVAAMNVEPSVFILRTGSNRCKKVFEMLQRNGVEVEDYEIDESDYYALPSLIKYLTKGTKLDLLMEVMGTDLPERKLEPALA